MAASLPSSFSFSPKSEAEEKSMAASLPSSFSFSPKSEAEEKHISLSMAASLPSSFSFSPKSEAEEKHDAQVYQTYSELIKTLPVSYCWPSVPLQQHQGFWFTGGHGLECVMAAQDHFTSLPGDILVCTLPKVGTTWLKALAFAVANRNDTPLPLSTLLTSNPHQCVPFLEIQLYDGHRIPNLDLIPSPRLLATHMQHHMLPNSVTNPTGDCKIVYLCRNPRDTFISSWMFVNKMSPYLTVEIEQALDCFVSGVIWGGPYWDHVKGYWEASKANPERVLFMRFEEMQKDTALELKRLAEFMGYPFSAEEEKDGVLEKIVELCSIKSLSSLKVNIEGAVETEVWSVKNSTFFRKGVVGDWKNHLTPEMVEKLDRAVEEKIEGCGLTFVGSYEA